MVGVVSEDAMLDWSSDDKGDLCRLNDLPARLRSEGEGASLDNGEASEGSMPSSSYEGDE